MTSLITHSNRRIGWKACWMAAIGLTLSIAAHGEGVALSSRTDVSAFIQEMVKKHHFDEKKLRKIFNQSHIDPSVIAKITRPSEALPWHRYRKLLITESRAKSGAEFWKRNQDSFAAAEKKYGVPAPIILAILGVETRYGRIQGKTSVMDALTTLSFNYPPRSSFFKKELKEYLLFCREQHWNPLKVKGSYAGAMGMPQFMPSNVRHYAVDFSKDGKIDLRRDEKDVIGSVANYLKTFGWKANQPILEPAKVKGKGYKKVPGDKLKLNRDIKELVSYGIHPVGRHPLKTSAIFMNLDGGSRPEYWLGFKNFYVISRYNHSINYSMAVALLADEIKKLIKNSTESVTIGAPLAPVYPKLSPKLEPGPEKTVIV